MSSMGPQFDEGQRNPFTMPSDEEVFMMRDEERKRRAAERETRRMQKVWERGNPAAITRANRINKLLKSAGDEVIKSNTGTHGGVMSTIGVGKDRRSEKESMAEFVAKKKEMFLVQMSLNTKREEIRKLEEKAQRKEEALKKSEQMLEEDAMRFDTFLKENDKKAHEAIKRAERETKLKADRVQEIKKLNQQMQMVQSDMSKHREALEDCLTYKSFLDRLTPSEFFEDRRADKKARQEQRRQARIAKKKEEYDAEKRRVMLAFAEDEKRREEALAKQGRVKKKGDKKARQPDMAKEPPNLAKEPLTSSGEDVPMYFTAPSQLLDMFQTLEEQNLFLIQNSQETEHALEELKQNFRVVQGSMSQKTQALVGNIEELNVNIAAETAKGDQLRKRIVESTGDTLDKQEELLQQLNEKVRDVYTRCGFDATSNPTTLFMLSDLEARLEDLLNAIAQMPEDFVARAEKEKEKKRREKKRAEQQAELERQQEERNRKAIERSMQAPKKRAGRQVMYKSNPVRRVNRQETLESNEEDLDELKHLT